MLDSGQAQGNTYNSNSTAHVVSLILSYLIPCTNTAPCTLPSPLLSCVLLLPSPLHPSSWVFLSLSLSVYTFSTFKSTNKNKNNQSIFLPLFPLNIFINKSPFFSLYLVSLIAHQQPCNKWPTTIVHLSSQTLEQAASVLPQTQSHKRQLPLSLRSLSQMLRP